MNQFPEFCSVKEVPIEYGLHNSVRFPLPQFPANTTQSVPTLTYGDVGRQFKIDAITHLQRICSINFEQYQDRDVQFSPFYPQEQKTKKLLPFVKNDFNNGFDNIAKSNIPHSSDITLLNIWNGVIAIVYPSGPHNTEISLRLLQTFNSTNNNNHNYNTNNIDTDIELNSSESLCSIDMANTVLQIIFNEDRNQPYIAVRTESTVVILRVDEWDENEPYLHPLNFVELPNQDIPCDLCFITPSILFIATTTSIYYWIEDDPTSVELLVSDFDNFGLDICNICNNNNNNNDNDNYIDDDNDTVMEVSNNNNNNNNKIFDDDFIQEENDQFDDQVEQIIYQLKNQHIPNNNNNNNKNVDINITTTTDSRRDKNPTHTSIKQERNTSSNSTDASKSTLSLSKLSSSINSNSINQNQSSPFIPQHWVQIFRGPHLLSAWRCTPHALFQINTELIASDSSPDALRVSLSSSLKPVQLVREFHPPLISFGGSNGTNHVFQFWACHNDGYLRLYDERRIHHSVLVVRWKPFFSWENPPLRLRVIHVDKTTALLFASNPFTRQIIAIPYSPGGTFIQLLTEPFSSMPPALSPSLCDVCSVIETFDTSSLLIALATRFSALHPIRTQLSGVDAYVSSASDVLLVVQSSSRGDIFGRLYRLHRRHGSSFETGAPSKRVPMIPSQSFVPEVPWIKGTRTRPLFMRQKLMEHNYKDATVLFKEIQSEKYNKTSSRPDYKKQSNKADHDQMNVAIESMKHQLIPWMKHPRFLREIYAKCTELDYSFEKTFSLRDLYHFLHRSQQQSSYIIKQHQMSLEEPLSSDKFDNVLYTAEDINLQPSTGLESLLAGGGNANQDVEPTSSQPPSAIDNIFQIFDGASNFYSF